MTQPTPSISIIPIHKHRPSVNADADADADAWTLMTICYFLLNGKAVSEEPVPKKGKSSLNTVQYGLKHCKRIHTYRCHEENCDFTGKSLCELNEHHFDLHGEVKCTGCDKTFKTPSSMKHHAYCHGELKYFCDVCKEGFAFESELRFHPIVHQTVYSFHCMANNHGKSYKSANELNKHVQKHSGVTWDCNVCEYSTDDRWNLRAHHKKHLKVGLHKCIPCNKSLDYYMQLKRHWVKPE